MTRTLTPAQILAVQDHAARTNDRALLRQAYAALGYDSAVAFLPATPDQVELGMAACAATLPTITIVCDDSHSPQLHWTGEAWSDRGAEAHCYDTRDDADLAIGDARDGIDERRRQYVSVEECV